MRGGEEEREKGNKWVRARESEQVRGGKENIRKRNEEVNEVCTTDDHSL